MIAYVETIFLKKYLGNIPAVQMV